MSKENKKKIDNNRFGHIEGIAVGDMFENFESMHAAGLHRQRQAGIAGISKQGAESIVISGGYEDDQDFGIEIIYTGQGGRNEAGKHTKDQELKRGNQALAVSQMEGLPVRVIRGVHRENKFAPSKGYRYDGLYCVDDHWHETGKSGFKVWRFHLSKLEDSVGPRASNELIVPVTSGRSGVVARTNVTVQRLLRDAILVNSLKQSYRHKCQVCRKQLVTAAGPYTEVAHIRPLGRPHNGPDNLENVLCLCPNHHVLFDLGAFGIADDFSLLGIPGELYVSPVHPVGRAHLAYHREHVMSLPIAAVDADAVREDESIRDLFNDSSNHQTHA